MKSSLTIKAKIAIFTSLVLVFVIALASCSISRKVQTANIIKKCEFSFQRASIDSIVGDSLKFSIFFNAKNNSTDSLFVQKLNGMAYLDSLFEIPVSLSKSLWLSPGNNSVQFGGTLQMNLFKLLALPSVKQFKIDAKANIALEPEQETTEISFSETKEIPSDMATKIIRKIVSGQ
ncbi:hypothetical protein AGMMS49938_10880 [Fibrobacterales bacterium]|nr:hypothetical protein AGMMS49938_10880 [Fibrobacterales bacterium]